MNKINKYINLLLFLVIVVVGCNKPVDDFGFDGSLSGKVVDSLGNIVPGDITSNGFIVETLGTNDNIPLVLRVKGDGTYANKKLYPKKYKVNIKGPISTSDTIEIDLTGNKKVVHDFVVKPFLSIAAPTVSGTPTSTGIDINYNIVENNGKVASTREIYCSSIPYPNASTGSGPYYTTIKVSLSAKQGVATITGLTAGSKYFIRIGAKATGATAFNYSDQIIVTTP